LYSEGKQADAYEMIVEAIVNDPHNPRLPLAMCKLLKHEERYQEAVKLIDALPDEIRKNVEIAQLRDLLSFYMEIDPAHDLTVLKSLLEASPQDVAVKQQLIAHYVIQQQYEPALQQLVSIMDTEPGYADNYAQKAMLRIFNLLGSDHPLIAQFRPALRRYSH